MDYNEPCCCFDSSMYTGIPDNRPTDGKIDIRAVITHLDELNNSGLEGEGQSYLEKMLVSAASAGDWRSELTILSELMGQYRRSADKAGGMRAVNEGMDIIRKHNMGSTVSGATILLNAATTMKCFGMSEQSIPVFRHVCRVFSDNLDPHDYRFAGLYNNMALSFADTGDFVSAESCFKSAIEVIMTCEAPENDAAVTYCNMAEMYDKISHEDERISLCMEKAWELLDSPEILHDGYHAFTISKCAPTFDYFGYFIYAKKLRKEAERIYARNR